MLLRQVENLNRPSEPSFEERLDSAKSLGDNLAVHFDVHQYIAENLPFYEALVNHTFASFDQRPTEARETLNLVLDVVTTEIVPLARLSAYTHLRVRTLLGEDSSSLEPGFNIEDLQSRLTNLWSQSLGYQNKLASK